MRLTLLFIFLFTTYLVQGQSDPDLLENLILKSKQKSYFKLLPKVDDETPDWAVLLYKEPNNFIEIQALKKEYFKTNTFKKNIHTQNYKHWFKIVKNHVNDQGIVEMPNQSELFFASQQNLLNQNSNTNQNVW